MSWSRTHHSRHRKKMGLGKHSGNTSGIEARLWGLKDGLLLARHVKIENLIVEVDALIVLQSVGKSNCD